MAGNDREALRAYVDTSALIAFLDASDSHHALFRRLFSQPPKLLTTTLTINEGHAWFLRRYDGFRARQFLAFTESLPMRVLAVGPRELRAGKAFIRKYHDQALTVVDAVGLHVLEAQRPAANWSTDRHLSLTGVPLVIHSEV
ncbi:MAG: PIN domain-containing protein [Nitrococcus sp.]|nr:PIN domain-containing protein [Nitrococcus sp.]